MPGGNREAGMLATLFGEVARNFVEARGAERRLSSRGRLGNALGLSKLFSPAFLAHGFAEAAAVAER